MFDAHYYFAPCSLPLGWGSRDWVEHDPDYDSLRDDPRFQRRLARLK
jgi:hypothetical protein